MSDLISRCELFNRLATVQTLGEAYWIIQEMPTVDAIPVRHGRWMHISPEPEVMLGWMPWYCSECGVGVGKHQSTFCPNCGARMDGKGNGNETD